MPAPVTAPPPFVMPPVHLGDVVIWRHTTAETDGAAALVTAVGQRGISVLIFPPDSRGGIPKNGVRHTSDPEIARVVSDDGVWEYTASHTRLLYLDKLNRMTK